VNSEPQGNTKVEKVTRAKATLEAMPFEPYVDINVASAALGVPVSWLYRQSVRPDGDVPVRRFGKYLRFRLSELEAWAQRSSNGNGKV
jgi:hypothetical protein